MPKSGARRKLQFATVGASGLAASFATLYAAVMVFGLHPSVGYVLQTVAALQVNFMLNDAWTWRDRRSGSYWRRLTRFYFSRLTVMLPLNQLLFWALNPHVGIYAANAVCIITATCANWFINDRFVFRKPRKVSL